MTSTKKSKYLPKEIESKWQSYWDEKQTYKANLASTKPKYISMSMFNYPSGAGIHIGHAMNYTISDVLARFKRQQGFESYHPVGWDSFGLPAENYAIKAGVSPQASMEQIIPNYHIQYKAMGWSNDWSKEIAAHTPEYYKWTQWIFSEMHRSGLAYQDARMQWWCDKCQTVLANEQVINNKCWRHDSQDDLEVSQKEVKQWFFRITEYADELLQAIDELDWTESVKLAQKNWIGKSIGAEITFSIEGKEKDITVFTTRPDTLFGATILVLAPENESISSLTTEENKKAVETYIKESLRRSEVERQANKEKTGVFTGSYAINPLSGERLPVWVADYVLMNYGTGAIMAVPAHDERDLEFAKKFDLPITFVIQGETEEDREEKVVFTGEGTLSNSGDYTGLSSSEAREKIVAELSKQGKGREKINYKMRDWSVSRQRYWGAPIPIVYCPDCGPVLVPDSELPILLPELKDFAPSGDGRSALARAGEWVRSVCPQCGKEGERETDTLDTYICSSWYMLRYFDPQNTKKIFDSNIINKWMPIDFYNGADHATAHMIYARFVTRFFYKKGLLNTPEPFKKFLFNGKVTGSDGQMFSKSKGNGVDPLEIISQGYGADSLRLYLMFAAPLEVWIKWEEQGVPASYRFLTRVWNLVQEYLASEKGDSKEDREVLKISHKTAKKVTEDLEEQHYNTAIASLMELTNDLYRFKMKGFESQDSWQKAIETLLMLLSPFAPHISEELWHQLGHLDSIHSDHWPHVSEVYLQEERVTMTIMINGKMRDVFEMESEESKEQKNVEEVARASEKVQKYLEGKEIKNVIFIPGRVLNFVI